MAVKQAGMAAPVLSIYFKYNQQQKKRAFARFFDANTYFFKRIKMPKILFDLNFFIWSNSE